MNWSKLRQQWRNWRGVWIVAPSVATCVVALRVLGLLQYWELATMDQYVRWRPTQARDSRVAIVGIDEADVRKIGQAIIPDAVYARLLEKLRAMQPRAIGLDVYRDLPVEPGHADLVQIFKSTPNLVGIQKVVGDQGRDAVAPAPALKEKGQVGANDLVFDLDNRVRRGVISLTDPNSGETVYSFSAYLALLYLHAEGLEPQIVPNTDNWWQLGEVMLRPFKAHDGPYVRADDGGYQVLINYRGSVRHFETVSMSDILENRVPADWAKDRVILIGFVGESFLDVLFTPYTDSAASRMSGVEIHANLVSQLLAAALDRRPLLRYGAPWLEGLWIVLWAMVGAGLTWFGRFNDSGRGFALQRELGLMIALGLLLGSTYITFLHQWWMPVIPALMGLSGSALTILGYTAYSAGQIRKTFGRYLTAEVVAELLDSPSALKMGGERRRITILTSDLRGFTAQSERLPPEEVIQVLNIYLGAMADAITQYGGTIDEFMGDGILVLFGAPTRKANDAQRAIACGLAMQLAMAGVNEKLRILGMSDLQMGIGINTGDVVVGNIGSEKRTKYGVVGSQVNLTYRIESYTTAGQILISESTLREAGDQVQIIGELLVKPKGVPQPITVYEVGGIGAPYHLTLPHEAEVLLPLTETIDLYYTILEGKHISDTAYQGCLVKLSHKGAEIKLDPTVRKGIPEPLNNLRINLVYPAAKDIFADFFPETSEDIYAKVRRVEANNTLHIHFTARPPEVEAQLKALYRSLSVSSDATGIS